MYCPLCVDMKPRVLRTQDGTRTHKKNLPKRVCCFFRGRLFGKSSSLRERITQLWEKCPKGHAGLARLFTIKAQSSALKMQPGESQEASFWGLERWSRRYVCIKLFQSKQGCYMTLVFVSVLPQCGEFITLVWKTNGKGEKKEPRILRCHDWNGGLCGSSDTGDWIPPFDMWYLPSGPR